MQKYKQKLTNKKLKPISSLLPPAPTILNPAPPFACAAVRKHIPPDQGWPEREIRLYRNHTGRH